MTFRPALYRLPPPDRFSKRYWRFLKRRLKSALLDTRVPEVPPASENPYWLTFEGTKFHYYESAATVVRDAKLPQKLAAYKRLLDAFLRERSARRPLRRLVIVVHVLHRVGGIISVVQLANDLIALGIDVKVVVLNPDGYVPDLGLNTKPIFFANRRDLIEHFPDADVVVGTLWSTMYFVMHAFLRRPRFLPAYFVQDYEPDFYHASDMTMRQHVEFTYSLTPFIFAKTRWICDRVARHGCKPALVPPALDLDLFRPSGATRDSSRPVILAMLRPSTPHRDATTTLSVLAEIYRRRPEVVIHTFGSDDATLSPLNIQFPFINHGRLPNDRLPALYSCADVYLECSMFHGFGRTVAEALACSTPCVVTASGGVEDFCVDGFNSLVRPVGDVKGLADAIDSLLADQSLNARLRVHCRDSVSTFDRRNSAARTLEFLERALIGANAHGESPPASTS